MQNETRQDALTRYLSEHIRAGGPFGDPIGSDKAAQIVAAAEWADEWEQGDKFVALMKGLDGYEVYPLGPDEDHVLDYGSELLHQGRLPAAILRFDGTDWSEADVEYTVRVA